MSQVKQVIIVRGDLKKMLKQKGKLTSQVAHAVLGSVFQKAQNFQSELGDGTMYKCIPLTADIQHWFDEEFTKISLRCVDEEHLLAIYDRVKDTDVLHALIKDAGHTVFAEPTYTCLGIGPADSDLIDEIIGERLPLL